MTATQTFIGYTHTVVATVGVVLGLATLGMWGRHLLIISDAYSMAQALAWTTLTLAVFGIVMVLERYGGA